MLFSAIIILGCFLAVIILILTEKMNRAVAALGGAVICFFTMTFLENEDFSKIAGYIIGSTEDGYVNLHSLILILGMMFIVKIGSEAGLFQFLSFRLVQMTKGKPVPLFCVLGSITVLISSVVNNYLTIIIMVPLTITVSRILNIDPEPYIITEALLINIGGTIFTISSIPNILIANSEEISFNDFFLNVGLLSLIVFVISLAFYILIYRKKLVYNPQYAWILEAYNVWNFVSDRRLLLKSTGILLGVFAGFLLIPSTFIPPDIIAIAGGLILMMISRLNARELIQKIDFELLLYLIGIFVIVGSLSDTGILDAIGYGLSSATGGDTFVNLMIILWVSSLLSAAIDNTPITKVLIPVVRIIDAHLPSAIQKTVFYSLTFGVNWGDNITPVGNNLLVINLAEQNKRPVNIKEFTRIGVISGVLQLSIVSMVYGLIYEPLIGGILLFLIAFVFLYLILRQRRRTHKKGRKL